MRNTKIASAGPLVAGLLSLSLGACTSPGTPASLIDAQNTYDTVANDPAVASKAALELQQAKDALATSQAAWQRDENRAETDHLAYLAKRQAEIAQETAQLKVAQDQVQNAGAARAQALLGARTVEAQQARSQAQQAQAEAAQLKQQVDKLRSDQANNGPVVLTLGDIVFDVDSAHLKPGASQTIDQIASFLKQHPDRTVAIRGYTDNSGSASHNQELSRARADSVRAAIVQQGVSPDRIVASGEGEAAPVASNKTEAGRQLNRRVEIAISGSGSQANSASGSSTP